METLLRVVRGCLTPMVRSEKQFEGSKEVSYGAAWGVREDPGRRTMYGRIPM